MTHSDTVECCPNPDCENARIRYRSQKKRYYCSQCATSFTEPAERQRQGHSETIASEIGHALATADPSADLQTVAKQAVGGDE